MDLVHEFAANPDPAKWAALFELVAIFGLGVGGPAFLLIRDAFRRFAK